MSNSVGMTESFSTGCGAEGPEGIRCNRPHTLMGWHQAFDGKRTFAWESAPHAPMHDDEIARIRSNDQGNRERLRDVFETTALEVLSEIALQAKRIADALEMQVVATTIQVLSPANGLLTAEEMTRAIRDLSNFAAHRSGT